ncbi:MAG: hypothetical protein M3Z97_02885 [Candidatus Dormibacteraeota bacterium]|nr:hypothetical protein [Candidatus Dormibacteraeota bacterium]
MSDNAGINVQVGPLRVDVPRTAGYYGGVAAALALGLIDWPVAVFIGAVPAIKLLQRGDLPRRVRFAVQLFEGAAKPVGGDGEGTVELVRTPPALKNAADTVARPKPRPRRSSPRPRGEIGGGT